MGRGGHGNTLNGGSFKMILKDHSEKCTLVHLSAYGPPFISESPGGSTGTDTYVDRRNT